MGREPVDPVRFPEQGGRMKTAFALAIGLAVGSLEAADWPRHRGPAQNGVSAETDWVTTWPGGQPKRLWKASVGTGFSSVAVAGGRVFTVGSDGLKKGGKDVVYCLEAETGKPVWTFGYSQDLDPKYYDGGPGATPTIDRGQVFVVGRHGWVHCLNAENGSVIWKRNLASESGLKVPEWGFNSSVHVEGDQAILNAGSFGIALDRLTGRELWVSGKDEAGYGTPVPFESKGRRLLAMFAAKHAVAVDPKDGTEVWRVAWKTSYDVNSSDPVFSQNRMFVSSGYNKGGAVYDLSGADPKQLWFNKEVRAHMSGSVIIGDCIYGVDGQGDDKDSQLKCLDLGTGSVRWASPKAGTGNLTAAGNRLLWITGGGELVVVDAKPDAYRELARAQVGGGKHWTAPTIANGLVYVRSAKGDLVCLDLRALSQ